MSRPLQLQDSLWYGRQTPVSLPCNLCQLIPTFMTALSPGHLLPCLTLASHPSFLKEEALRGKTQTSGGKRGKVAKSLIHIHKHLSTCPALRQLQTTYVCINLAYALCLNISTVAKAPADILMYTAAFLQHWRRAEPVCIELGSLLLSVCTHRFTLVAVQEGMQFLCRDICMTRVLTYVPVCTCTNGFTQLWSPSWYRAWPQGSPDFNKSWREEAAGGEKNFLFF